MSIVSGIVLFAVIWFMVLFIILPIRVQSQIEAGERVAGLRPARHRPRFR